jgi:HAD superfamily hydrolase (TIGR01459 family)
MKKISSIATIAARYDALLLDLWGVVHDGTHLYPGAKEAMTQLKKAGKKIILVSNAPRRSHKAITVLGQLGVTPDLYDHVITSGELGYQWLAGGNADWGKRYYYIGPGKDADILHGLDYVRTDDLRQCDFLLNVGFGSEEEQAADFAQLLRSAAAQGLPMLCLNPDLEVVKITGERFACAGVLAADYEKFNGAVTYFGKPFAAVYDYCLKYLAPTDESHILAVGDGIMTDIKGAVDFGLDAVLVTGGIFKKDEHAIEALCEKHGAVPRYIMPALAW